MYYINHATALTAFIENANIQQVFNMTINPDKAYVLAYFTDQAREALLDMGFEETAYDDKGFEYRKGGYEICLYFMEF